MNNNCDEYAVKILRYLDNDLKGSELEEFVLHLDSCGDCRTRLHAEKELSATLQRSRPLYSAPAALRDRVSAAVTQSPKPKRVQETIFQRVSFLGNWRVLAPVALAIALCLTIVPNIERRLQAASYVDTAVASHRRYVSGDLDSRLNSNSPELVTAWFAGKVPFDFRLPAVESSPEKNLVYRLTGAALVSYKGSPTALVTYETQNDKISLLVDSCKSAVVAGGDEVQFGKLVFHYHNESGFRVITWNNHGLSYALVSSVSGPAHASCLVCHQNLADRDIFRTQ